MGQNSNYGPKFCVICAKKYTGKKKVEFTVEIKRKGQRFARSVERKVKVWRSEIISRDITWKEWPFLVVSVEENSGRDTV